MTKSNSAQHNQPAGQGITLQRHAGRCWGPPRPKRIRPDDKANDASSDEGTSKKVNTAETPNSGL